MQTLFSLSEVVAGDDVVRLVGAGELDMATAPRFERLTAEVVYRVRPRRLLIDLSAVTFLDAAGLAALSACRQHALGYGTDLRVTAAQGIVRRVLDLTNLWTWLSDEP